MRLRKRFLKLSLWNKIALFGSIASIISFLIIFIPFSKPPSNSQNIPNLPRAINAGRDVVISDLSTDKTKLADLGKSIELIEIMTFFLSESSNKWKRFEFTHGTTGQLPVVWSKPPTDEKMDASSKMFTREGILYVMVNGKVEMGISNNGEVQPWTISLHGVHPYAKFGYWRIEIKSSGIKDLRENIPNQLKRKGFNISSKILDKDFLGWSIWLGNISKRGYHDASIIVSESCGSRGFFYHISIYPFNKITSGDVVINEHTLDVSGIKPPESSM